MNEPGPAPPVRPRAWLVAATVILLAVVSAASVLVARNDASPETRTGSSPTATPPPPSEPVADVARIVLPSTVRIHNEPGSGSGFIYDSDGLILTAAHVVGSAEQVDVRLPDGARVEGRVLGRDTRRDVAVVKVERKGLRAAKLARGVDVRVGQLAVALGSPFGLVDTVTAGVVSGIGRSFPTPDGVVDAIQTDAPVNPGNSGGPLADRQGRVIGINFAARGRGSDTIGFAVPIDVALQAAERLQVGATPPPVAFMGVSGTDGAEGRAGALLTEVEAGSPGAAAGLQDGDLVTAIDGERLEGMSDLASAIRRRAPGDRVGLTVVRDGRERRMQVVLTARP